MRSLVIAGLLLTISCREESTYIFEEAIPEDVIPYFERFANEGEKRGFIINWEEEDVHVMFVDIEDEAVGQCLSFERGRNEINFDQKYWESLGMIDREFLVFHELGHCVLGRSHFDQVNRDGTCQSIMNSSDRVCTKNYNLVTREKYLDELFK